ncbi:MAG: site-specific integrase [bacterium]
MIMKQNLSIPAEGKIDIHKSSVYLEKALAGLVRDTIIHQENRDLILRFIRDCRLGKTVIGRAKKRIGPATCLKYLANFKIMCREFTKPFDAITQNDMELFVERLESDAIQTKKGRPFSDETKAGIKKAIRKFWKWKDGDNKTYPELVEWIETYAPVKEIPALSRADVQLLIERSSNPRDKALLMVLFDCGARIEELLNVRLKADHLFWKEETGCFMIRLEFSKTKPRTVSAPLSTRYLKGWLTEHPLKDNPHAQLFPMSYAAVRMLISRLGRRVLSRRVTPHMLRHSSATYYANKLNRYQLCYRYGWAMSSDMVDRYIDREGISEKETANAIKADEISKAQKESLGLSEELALLRESHSDLSDQFQKLQSQLQALESGKGVLSLLASLAQKAESRNIPYDMKRGFDLVLSGESLSTGSAGHQGQ